MRPRGRRVKEFCQGKSGREGGEELRAGRLDHRRAAAVPAERLPRARDHLRVGVDLPFECATIAEVLGERGWNTYMTGKWHLTAEDEMNLASRKAQWPIGWGFERFYGFLDAETNHWYPDLVYDNHPVEQPCSPEEGYHLTEDLTDKALEFILESTEPLPAGRTVLSASFEREGDTMPAEGTLTLHAGEKTVGQAGSGPSPVSSPSPGRGSTSARTPASR